MGACPAGLALALALGLAVALGSSLGVGLCTAGTLLVTADSIAAGSPTVALAAGTSRLGSGWRATSPLKKKTASTGMRTASRTNTTGRGRPRAPGEGALTTPGTSGSPSIRLSDGCVGDSLREGGRATLTLGSSRAGVRAARSSVGGTYSTASLGGAAPGFELKRLSARCRARSSGSMSLLYSSGPFMTFSAVASSGRYLSRSGGMWRSVMACSLLSSPSRTCDAQRSGRVEVQRAAAELQRARPSVNWRAAEPWVARRAGAASRAAPARRRRASRGSG